MNKASKMWLLLLSSITAFTVACGGGGGGNTAGNMPDDTPVNAPTVVGGFEDRPDTITTGHVNQRQSILDAATAIPKFGSVAQSSNVDANGRTTDTVSATFDGQVTEVTVTYEDNSTFTFGSDTPAWFQGTIDTTALFVPETHTDARFSYHAEITESNFFASYIERGWGGPSDWYVGGYWIRANGNPYQPGTSFEIGAYVDSPEIDPGSPPTLPSTGTASYRGGAQGVYYHDYADTSREIGQYIAPMTLTIDFASSILNYGCSGCTEKTKVYGHHVDLQGNVTAFSGVETDYRYEGQATVNSDGTFQSTRVTFTNPNRPITNHGGSFGGIFSNIPDAGDNPRMVAGTTGGFYEHADGSNGAWVGTFLGTTKRDGRSAIADEMEMAYHHPDIPWLLNKSNLRLNEGTNTANVALNELPDNSIIREQLNAEFEKINPSPDLYYNVSTLFGKYEGMEAADGNPAIDPGEWTLESDCSGVGRCILISDTADDYHIVTASGDISPYFIGTVPWDRDGDPNNVQDCDGTNAATCERKAESTVVIRPSLSGEADSDAIMTANRIAMVQERGTGRTASANDPFDYVSYGAWMSHSGFFIDAYLYDLPAGRSRENAARTLGITAGSNPAPQSGQILTWNGVMAGMRGSQAVRRLGDPYNQRDFDPVQGDAMVTVSDNGGNLEIGVVFTDIFYLDPANTSQIQDITWSNSQIVSDANGRFTSTQHNLKAAFYGPNHEEVAGTYEKVDGDDFMVGAFGAKQ